MFKNVGSRTMRQDTPGTVERPPARYNMTIAEAEAIQLLNDPIEFAQNIGRVLEQGELSDVLMVDVPKQVDDARCRLESLLELAIERGDTAVIQKVLGEYIDFVTHALAEAREYGVAFGAVLEQLRMGLLDIHDLRNRGMTRADVNATKDASELRRKYNLLPSDQKLDWHAGIGDSPKRPDGQASAAD